MNIDFSCRAAFCRESAVCLEKHEIFVSGKWHGLGSNEQGNDLLTSNPLGIKQNACTRKCGWLIHFFGRYLNTRTLPLARPCFLL